MMDKIAKFRRWLESIKSTSPDCNDGDASIVLVAVTAPPEARYCFYGGAIHCRHGADRCCYCAFRKQAMN